MYLHSAFLTNDYRSASVLKISAGLCLILHDSKLESFIGHHYLVSQQLFSLINLTYFERSESNIQRNIPTFIEEWQHQTWVEFFTHTLISRTVEYLHKYVNMSTKN